MEEKSTEKFDAINKEATVGTRTKILVFNPPAPKRGEGTPSVTIKTSKKRRRPCSGCSRKRKSK